MDFSMDFEYQVPAQLDEMIEDPDMPPPTSHEKYWIFNFLSQKGEDVRKTNGQKLKGVYKLVIDINMMGMQLQCPWRSIHYAQILTWRYFFVDNDMDPANFGDFIPTVFSIVNSLTDANVRIPVDPKKNIKDQILFQESFIRKLDNQLIPVHPIDCIRYYITNDFTVVAMKHATKVINDSYLFPLCLVYSPYIIAEGAAMLGATLANIPYAAINRTKDVYSFLSDYKQYLFYRRGRQ